MMYMQYAGITVICFLGLLAGITLCTLAREEVVQGRRWLFLLKKTIFFLLVATLLYFYHNILYVGIILAGGGIGYLLLNCRSIYFLFGICIGLLFSSPTFFPVALLVFLFGLPTGSLMASTRKDAAWWRMMGGTTRDVAFIFFLPAMFLPLLLSYL